MRRGYGEKESRERENREIVRVRRKVRTGKEGREKESLERGKMGIEEGKR